MGKLQRAFLTGLLTLLPIWLVWVVFKFVFGLLSGLSAPIITPLITGAASRFGSSQAEKPALAASDHCIGVRTASRSGSDRSSPMPISSP